MSLRMRCHRWMALLTLSIASLPALPADPPSLRALFVGIGTYQNADAAGLRELRGPANDVSAVKNLVIERFGLKGTNATVLLNEQATRTSVLAAIKKVLVDDAKSGDVALFYFSGHGSRAFDASSDEPSKFDSTILPYDARAKEGQALDIIDDELGALVSASLAKGAKPVVILDSCNSGTGIRFHAQARFAPPIKRAAAITTAASEPLSMREIASGHGTLLAAAQDTEEALEMERDGVVHGEFTRALVAVLKSSEPGVTYLDVLTRVRINLGGLGVPHRPQGEGDLQQRFLGTGPLGRPPILAESVDASTVRLKIGAASAVTVGSRYDFFGTAAAATAAKSPLASGVVQDVQPDSATVQLASAAATLPSILFALERSHAYGDLKLQVAIVGGIDTQRTQLEAVLAKLDYVKVVKAGAATHWLQIKDVEVHLTLADGSSLGYPTKLGTDLEESLALQLVRLAHVHALLALKNPKRPKSPIMASIVLANSEADSAVTSPTMRDGEARVGLNQTYKVTLFNTEAKARHVYLLNLAASLCVNLLSPPPGGKDEPLIGLSRTKLLKAGPARGRETFLIIATDTPISVDALPQRCLDPNSMRTAVAKRYADPLAQLLGNARSTRRGEQPSLPLDGWSTGFLTMVVD